MRGVTIIDDFDVIHTGDDLDLVQESKDLGVPTPQSYTVEIVGRNGSLNLTKALSGCTCYNNRTITLRYFATGTRDELLALKDKFNLYHGEWIKIVDDDTPLDYYEGEARVQIELKGNYALITMVIDALPFRYGIEETKKRITLTTAPKDYIIYNDGVEVVPTFKVVGNGSIKKGDTIVRVTNNTYTIDDLKLSKGKNIMTFSGSGTIEMIYREARL